MTRFVFAASDGLRRIIAAQISQRFARPSLLLPAAHPRRQRCADQCGLGSLFAAGSETGKGCKETSAKPELFQNPQRVGELAGNFNREANELAKIAATGDAAAVKAQFGKLGQTCKACHDDFKAKD